MRITRRVGIQLVVFSLIALVALSVMALGCIRLPAMFGVGRYTVTMELPRSGGLYPRANVTYRGTEVGKVESVDLGNNGDVIARLSLKSDTHIPSNLKAEVHSQSAIGEQFVALLPRDDTSAPLRNGDIIAAKDTSIPPSVDSLLDSTNRGLLAIPHDDLKTAVDESYTAVGGLGSELSRIVKGSTQIAIDARANLDSLTSLIDNSASVLDTQIDTSDSVQAWASHVASITSQLRDHDKAVAGVLDNGGPAADEAGQLLQRLQPTLPIILANLASVGKVVLDYHPAVEQLLVLVPQAIANAQGTAVADHNLKSPYAGSYLSFNLNLNLPPPCTTGFLPAQQHRTPVATDAPDRPAGALYCRVPQDSPFDVRGARNLPCLTVPGKRAPFAWMCDSDQQYVPLNDGYNWKGDPNATLSGQDIPQLGPGDAPRAAPAAPQPAAPAPPPDHPPLAVAPYDPATGDYVGPDGRVHTRPDLAQNAPKDPTWQTMLLPPNGN
ncbi:MCE family protein [Mycolicibacterium sp. CH28]|uniref:MCE family protein n=1 Tax=Mycolicibacterium sp. CH28 TaxID=2512237 RepID=UPI001080E7CE|nr:MlaD family protein [Mycolicibacterium sp. CH28]TGD87533.1 MCE family protein [Mycolicibacterium sp. CH28]